VWSDRSSFLGHINLFHGWALDESDYDNLYETYGDCTVIEMQDDGTQAQIPFRDWWASYLKEKGRIDDTEIYA